MEQNEWKLCRPTNWNNGTIFLQQIRIFDDDGEVEIYTFWKLPTTLTITWKKRKKMEIQFEIWPSLLVENRQ